MSIKICFSTIYKFSISLIIDPFGFGDISNYIIGFNDFYDYNICLTAEF